MQYKYDLSILVFIRNISNDITKTIHCFESLHPTKSIEFIFVNDALKYKHLKVVNHFVETHDNARIFKRGEKGRGVSNCYNLLLDSAEGKYVLYLTCAATIDNETIDQTVNYLDNSKVDLAFLNLKKKGLSKSGAVKNYHQYFNKGTGEYTIDHQFLLLDRELSFVVRADTKERFKIKKSFLTDDNIRVDFYHKFIFDIVDKTGKCGYVEEAVYQLPLLYTYKYYYKKLGAYLRKQKKLKIRALRYHVQHLVSLFYSLIYRVDQNKVVFVSDTRKEMGGNLKNVYEYLTDLGYDTIIEFKWDRRARRSFKDKFKLIRNLSTAKYIFLEDFSNSITHTHFRKSQEIVQLWHGPGAYKRFGHSRAKSGEFKESQIHKGYKKYTKATVSGPYINWCYAEAFGIDESKVKATGFPRTDDFFNEDYLKEVKDNFYQLYPELKEKKIILFAPTYRGSGLSDASYDFEQIDFDHLYKQYKDEYVFVVKWHGFLQNNIKLGKVHQPDYAKYNGFVYDLSDYRDINELLVVCDTLITDYSSLIFDYVLLNKPIIYFAYDLNDYTGEGSRGLYFDFDEYVYGEVATTSKEMVKAIQSNNLMMDKRIEFYNKFMGACDGYSTEKTCKWVLGIDYKENKKLIQPYKKEEL